MPTLRDIKRRITSVRSTQQITSAMKMVSAAKLNRAQSAVRAAQPYAEKLRQMVSSLHGTVGGEDHPLFTEREGGPSRVILFTSDRGLCGNFNNNLSRTVHAILAEEKRLSSPELMIFGRTGNDFFKRRAGAIHQAFVHLNPKEMPSAVTTVIQEATDLFARGELGGLYIAFNYFYNPIRQEPRFHQLLPIPAPEGEEGVDQREILFEPARNEIMDSLLPAYLRNQGLTALLNTVAGEHGARMVAMDAATKNAGEMIESLTLQYNRARQAAITKELIEIVSGAQAV